MPRSITKIMNERDAYEESDIAMQAGPLSLIPKIYTFGYAKHDPTDLVRHAQALDAVVYDVRLKPYARDTRWNKDALQRLLGASYEAIGRIAGNRNYRGDGGEFDIVDLEATVDRLQATIIDDERAVILLCVCSRPGECHRSVIALEAQKWTSAEIVILP